MSFATFRAAAIALVAAFATLAAAAATTGIVNRVDGKVVVKRGTQSAPLAALDEIASGDEVDLAAGARLVVVYLSGSEFTLAGSSHVVFADDGPHTLGGTAPVVRAPMHASASVPVRASGVAQAALVMRSGDETVPRTAKDILALLDEYRPDPALVGQYRKVLDAPIPADAGAGERFTAHRKRARAAELLALTGLEVRELQEALATNQASPAEAWSLQQDLYFALRESGAYSQALRLKRHMLDTDGDTGPRLTDLLELAAISADLGDLSSAHELFDEATQAVQPVPGKLSKRGHNRRRVEYQSSKFDRARGRILLAEGHFREAEAAFRAAHDRREQLLEDGPVGVIYGRDPTTSIERHVGLLDGTEQGIAQALMPQGRLIEAEFWARLALTRVLGRLGRDSVRSVQFVRFLATVLTEQGRFAESERLLQSAVRTLDSIGTANDSRTYAMVLRGLAANEVGRMQWKEAAGTYDRLRDLLAHEPELSRVIFADVYTWAPALYETGRAGEAVAMMEAYIGEREKALGAGNPRLAQARGFYAIALQRHGERERALAQFSKCIPILISQPTVASGLEGSAIGRVRRTRAIVDGYIELLHDMGATFPRGGGDGARDEAFRVSDAARDRAVDLALGSAAARAFIDQPDLAASIRSLQDIGLELAAATRRLEQQLSLAPDVRRASTVQDLRASIARLGKDQAQQRAALESKYPPYASLVNPRLPTMGDVRQALHDGEVLVDVLVGERATQVWVVPRVGSPTWISVPIGEPGMRDIVNGLRRALDPGEVAAEDLPAFDVAAAHALYRSLLQPVDGAWKDARTLIVVANGPLAELPLGLLVTDDPPPSATSVRFEGYRHVPWLIRRVAIAQLPTVSTLVTLRSMPPAHEARSPYIGFGDPRFGKLPAEPLRTASALNMRNLSLRRVSATAQDDLAWTPYAALPALPDTREEVLALAIALQADAVNDVYLGADASRANALAANVANRRIVAFATHGLLPGDFPGLDEPALALSSESASEGLLTLQDVLGLKLDADWVVLSACNSGAGDGKGAEAISGLGRAFFYAGTRSVLVTHWPVETRSARELVTQLFRRYAADASMTRAQALREAMLAVMDGPPALDPASGSARFAYAHPLFWAPYSLVGDPGR